MPEYELFWKFKIYRFTNYHYTLEPGPWHFLAFFLEKLTTGIKKKEWPLDCFHPKCHASFYDIIDAQLTQDIYFTSDF